MHSKIAADMLEGVGWDRFFRCRNLSIRPMVHGPYPTHRAIPARSVQVVIHVDRRDHLDRLAVEFRWTVLPFLLLHPGPIIQRERTVINSRSSDFSILRPIRASNLTVPVIWRLFASCGYVGRACLIRFDLLDVAADADRPSLYRRAPRFRSWPLRPRNKFGVFHATRPQNDVSPAPLAGFSPEKAAACFPSSLAFRAPGWRMGSLRRWSCRSDGVPCIGIYRCHTHRRKRVKLAEQNERMVCFAHGFGERSLRCHGVRDAAKFVALSRIAGSDGLSASFASQSCRSAS